jgi:hypothetical protein
LVVLAIRLGMQLLQARPKTKVESRRRSYKFFLLLFVLMSIFARPLIGSIFDGLGGFVLFAYLFQASFLILLVWGAIELTLWLKSKK